jgi:hypothetical protein
VLRELASGSIERVNVDALGNAIARPSRASSLSSDGRFVAYETGPVLLGQSGQLYVRDRVLGSTFAVCAKHDGTSGGVGYLARLSGDGTTIAFGSITAMTADPVAGSENIYARGIGAPLDYCIGKSNSAGCVPSIGFSGAARVSNGYALTVTCTQVVNNKAGLLIHGSGGGLAVPFASGILCVAQPRARSIVTGSGGNPPPNDCSGVWSLSLGAVLAASPLGGAIGAGSVLNLQWWGRDSGAPPNNVQLSNALQVVVAP